MPFQNEDEGATGIINVYPRPLLLRLRGLREEILYEFVHFVVLCNQCYTDVENPIDKIVFHDDAPD